MIIKMAERVELIEHFWALSDIDNKRESQDASYKDDLQTLATVIGDYLLKTGKKLELDRKTRSDFFEGMNTQDPKVLMRKELYDRIINYLRSR